MSWELLSRRYMTCLLYTSKLLKMVQKEGTSTIGGVCYTGALLLRIFLQQVLEYPLKEEGKRCV